MTSLERLTFAREIEYEVRMLVEQVEFLERTASERTDPEGRLELGADGQALVEASLVHLRLLDEFLGGRPSNEKDYRATDWLGGAWDHEGFLTTSAIELMPRSRT